MSCMSIHPPTDTTWSLVFGWVTEDNCDAGIDEDAEVNYVCYNNLANIAGYILSPIIGLIRIIANAYFLAKGKDVNDDNFSDDEKGYLKAQIARGFVEFLGGGYLLWIPDLISTIHRIYKQSQNPQSS